MKSRSVPVDSIHLDPANARRHPERNVAAIKASLARFGQVTPLVVDLDNVVRKGNGTLLAARELGWAKVDVVDAPKGAVEATAYSVADNRSSDLGENDDAALAAILRALQAEGIPLEDVGYADAEFDALIASLQKPGEEDWADTFEKEGDASAVDDQKQVTFVMGTEDHDALMGHLKTFDKNKNVAIVKWLSSSGR